MQLEDFENGKYSDEASEPKGAPAKADDPWAVRTLPLTPT